MAVVSHALGSVIAGLVTQLQAATGFKSPSESGSDIPVFDGAVTSDASMLQCVVIGSDGDPDSLQRPGAFRSEWHDIDLTMDETGQVRCAVVVWSGDSSAFSSQRSTALGILEDVDTALRSSVSAASLGVTQLLWCHVSSGDLAQAATVNGTETRLAFTIDYRALLQVT